MYTGAGCTYTGAGCTYTGAGCTYTGAGCTYTGAGCTYTGAGCTYTGAGCITTGKGIPKPTRTGRRAAWAGHGIRLTRVRPKKVSTPKRRSIPDVRFIALLSFVGSEQL